MAVTVDTDITGIGGGGASISGTPSSGQLAIWSSASAQRGDAAFAVSDVALESAIDVSDNKASAVRVSVNNEHASGPSVVSIVTASGGTADSYINFSNQGQIYQIGLDNSASDKFAISAGGSLGTTDAIRVTVEGYTEIVSRVGFYGETPSAQPAPQADASGGTIIDAEARTALNGLLAKLRTLGIIDT